MIASTLISIPLGTIILAIGMSSWRLSLACLAVLCAGLLWTASFGLITVGRFNVISITFAAMFVGLGIDYVAHLGSSLPRGAPRGQRSRRSSSHHGGIAVFTAAVVHPDQHHQLCSFAPTAYKGIAELGLISSGGMILSVIINYTLATGRFDCFAGPLPFRSSARRSQHCLSFSAFSDAAPGNHSAVTFIACLIAGWGASKVWFDPDF